jgi:membrane fusion protein (multidrug efflux system)
MKKRRLIYYIFIFIVVLLVTAGCDRLQGGKKDNEKDQAVETQSNLAYRDDVGTVFAVNTTKAVKGEILDYLEVNGDVVTQTSVDIYADTAGKLTKLFVSLGSYVNKDQVVAEVDPSKPGMKFVPSPVKSPIAGTIIEITARIGATISSTMPVARISQMNRLEIRTHISERFISKIRLGLEALLHFEAYPEERFRALVTELSPVVDPQSRTMEVKLNLVKPDRRIKTGMFTEIKIITERKQGIVKIPAECMVKRYGGYYVFVVREAEPAVPGGQSAFVEKRKVTPGIEIDSKLEIAEGLEPEEEVVIRGQTLLEDKAKVKVIERIQPLAETDIVE